MAMSGWFAAHIILCFAVLGLSQQHKVPVETLRECPFPAWHDSSNLWRRILERGVFEQGKCCPQVWSFWNSRQNILMKFPRRTIPHSHGILTPIHDYLFPESFAHFIYVGDFLIKLIQLIGKC